jgi:heterodisulfide reductase subunit D
MMQNADQIVAECRDLIAKHSLDGGKARNVVVKAMLGDQPLPIEADTWPAKQGASKAASA